MAPKTASPDPAVICGFMQPKPKKPLAWHDTSDDTKWWIYRRKRWIPRPLTLDLIHQVEEELTDEQWLFYGALCWKWYTEALTANDYEISMLNKWRRRLMHL